MTKEKYFSVCEQLGKEPVPDRIPPGVEDLPYLAQVAIDIFNRLGDRVYPDIGYIGKDYTNLSILMELYGINNESDQDLEFFLDTLEWLDSRAIKKSAEHIKREMKKLKSKHSG